MSQAADTPSCYRIDVAEGKGLGVFATRDIEPGELVLKEAPLLQLTYPWDSDQIRLAVGGLSAAVSAEFWKLVDKASEKTAEGVFRCNFWEMDVGEDGGVYADICRINHSCQPNCAHSFDTSAAHGEIHALRRIAAGDELTLTYVEARWPRAERREELAEKYGFICRCNACRAPNLHSDLRRWAVHCCEQVLGNCSQSFKVSAPPVKRAACLRRSAEILRLVALEGLEAAEDVDARACSCLARLHGRSELQSRWTNECLRRYTLTACGTVVRRERTALEESLCAGASDHLPFVFNAVD